MIDRFGPGAGHLNYLAVLGVGIFEFFVPVTTNHFPGWGISVIFDLTFLPEGREFYSNFLENVKYESFLTSFGVILLALALPILLKAEFNFELILYITIFVF